MRPIVEIILTGFVPRFFLGLVFLGIAADSIIPLVKDWLQWDMRSMLLLYAVADGLVIGFFSWLAPLVRRTGRAGPSPAEAAFGFAAGMLAPLILDPALGTLTLGVILMLSAINLRRFIHFIRILLHPGVTPRWTDVRALVVIHINLLATYTILNIALAVHSGEGKALAKAFGFSQGSKMVVDALYFSVVLMTTVGFGDIAPLSPLARLLVSIEALLSYFMLALTIGVVTRGIVSAK